MGWKKSVCTLFAGAAISAGAAEYTVPEMRTAPVIDGRINEKEWKNALKIGGAGNPVDPRKAEVFLTWDTANLYIAVRSETPPRGRLVTAPKAINIVMDDSVEFWFDPPKASRTVEQAKFGEFQLIASHTGALFQQHHNPGYGLPARKWLADIKAANSVHDGVWEIEIAIPAQAFGYEKLSEGDWKILPVRNFRTEPGRQAPFTPCSSFMDSQSYANFKLRRNAPAVSCSYAGGRLPLRVEAVSPKNENYEFEFRSGNTVDSGKIAGTEASRIFALPAPEKAGRIKITLRNSKKEILLNREFDYKPVPERIWFTPESHITVEQDFENGAGTLSCPQGMKGICRKEIASVPGRTEHTSAGHFKNGSVEYCDAKLAVPGNLSFWVRTDEPLKTGYRRFFASAFRSSGYLGLQEHQGYMLLFLHHFKGGNQNLIINRKPVPGQWTHLSVNLNPKRVEYYLNGVKYAELDLKFELEPEKLGGLVLGGGTFAMDDLVVYDRTLAPNEIKAMAQGESKLSGELSWYPSLNSMVLDITCNPEKLGGSGMLLRITDSQGKQHFSTGVSMKKAFDISAGKKNMKVIHEKIPLGRVLAEGRYFVSLSDRGTKEILLEKEFHVKHYPWLGNRLGRKDRILPPFTPLKAEGQTLSCILRDYKIGNNGMPEEVFAKGRQILASPVALHAVKDGKTTPYPAGKIRITKQTPTVIEYFAETSAADVKGRLEQDGLLRLDIRFKPGEMTPDRVYLDIPVKKEFATLFHAVGEHIRANPAGFIPSGTGTVFKSRSIPQIHISNFIPYLWIGDDECGISYAADWDKGWIHSKERDAVELFRHKNGDVSIRLNLINASFPQTKDREITIALMASPVKPMPEGWRGWSDGYGFKGTRVALCLMSPPYWGSHTGWCSRYPAFHDFTYIRKLAEARDTGRVDSAFIREWLARVDNAPKAEVPWVKSYGLEYASRHVNAAFQRAKALYPYKDHSVLYFYTCDSDGAQGLAEYPVFQDEWNTGVGVFNSYQDYAIWYLDKMLDAGMTGVYDDNTFFRSSYSWATGNAYIDNNGMIQPGFGLWSNREYRKRQLTLMTERGLEPWITVHHTNANILPTLGFATNAMGMEWKYGIHDFQSRFTPDYIRAVCQGLQGGFFPTVLDGIIGGDREKRLWATRTMLACLLPHEIRPTAPRGADSVLLRKVHDTLYDFGIGRNDCVYTAYWNPENPVKSSDSGLLVSTYRRGRKLMIVCGSYTGDILAELKCRGRIVSAKNAETGTVLRIDGDRIIFPVKKHDFALIEAEME